MLGDYLAKNQYAPLEAGQIISLDATSLKLPLDLILETQKTKGLLEEVRLPIQIPTLIGGGELIVFVILVIIGIIVIMLLATVIHFIIPIIAGVIVWFVTSSLLYAGIAFLVIAVIQLLARR